MRHIKTAALAAALIVMTTAAALAAQGPGVSNGTAGPLLHWAGFACFIFFCTLGVVFSQWDDGTYGDF